MPEPKRDEKWHPVEIDAEGDFGITIEDPEGSLHDLRNGQRYSEVYDYPGRLFYWNGEGDAPS